MKKADSNERVKTLIAEGFHLTSFIAFPENFEKITSWILVYYNPKTQKVFSVEVDGEIKIGEKSEPLIEGQYEEIDISGVEKADKILSILEEKIKEQRLSPTKIILSLREGKWITAVTTVDFKLVRMDFDMKTGEILHFDLSTLVKSDEKP